MRILRDKTLNDQHVGNRLDIKKHFNTHTLPGRPDCAFSLHIVMFTPNRGYMTTEVGYMTCKFARQGCWRHDATSDAKPGHGKELRQAALHEMTLT